jgi:hypothetical protein
MRAPRPPAGSASQTSGAQISAAAPMATQAARQPAVCPSHAVIGMPRTVATVSPPNTMASAPARPSGGAIAAAAAAAVGPISAAPSAMPMRATATVA